MQIATDVTPLHTPRRTPAAHGLTYSVHRAELSCVHTRAVEAAAAKEAAWNERFIIPVAKRGKPPPNCATTCKVCR